VTTKTVRYVVDPADPRAPSVEVWDAMTKEERAAVLAALPSDAPLDEASPPEGDAHWRAQARARRTLEEFFTRKGRRVYIGAGLAVYYPAERMFSPDLIAVLDVDPHDRELWNVSAEGKGIDLAMEVLVSGDRRKDLKRNVEWFGRLGISEYFVFDVPRARLSGFRLTEGKRVYEPIVPQAGRWRCRVLGLDLVVEEGRLRFFDETAMLLDGDEIVRKLERHIDEIEARLEDEMRTVEAERRLREEEIRRREETERLLAEARAELARLGAKKDESS
jgi:Uma2 family endonuclease